MQFDVEELEIHGGSLRVYVKHMYNSTHEITNAVSALENKEKSFGVSSIQTYDNFKNQVLDLNDSPIVIDAPGKISIDRGGSISVGNGLANTTITNIKIVAAVQIRYNTD